MNKIYFIFSKLSYVLVAENERNVVVIDRFNSNEQDLRARLADYEATIRKQEQKVKFRSVVPGCLLYRNRHNQCLR